MNNSSDPALKSQVSRWEQVQQFVFSANGMIVSLLGLYGISFIVVPPPLDGVYMQPAWFWINQLGTLTIAVIIHIFVHEMGHVLGGWLVGFRFASIGIGPIAIKYNERRLQVQFRSRWQLAGSALSVPVDEKNLIMRDFIDTAGGPMGNVMLGGLAFIIQLILSAPDHDGDWRITAHILLDMILVLAPVFVVASLMPKLGSRKSGTQSDGQRLIMMLKRGPAARRWVMMRRLVGAMRQGERPREWRDEWMTTLLISDPPVSDYVSAMYMMYLRARDAGYIEQAGAYLDAVLEAAKELNPLHYAEYALQAVDFEAYHRRNAIHARELYNTTQIGVGDPSTWCRAEAALLLVEGDYAGASARAADGLQANQCERDHDTAMGDMEAEWFQMMIDEADHALVAPSKPAHSVIVPLES